MDERILKWLSYGLLPAALLAFWAAASHSGRIPALLLPTPESVAAAFVALLSSGELARHIGASALRSLSGFGLAASLGIALGLINARSDRARRAGHIVLEALRVTPPLSVIPLLILWLGIDEAPKIAIVFLTSFFPIYMNTLTAVRGVDPKLEEVGRVLRFSPAERFRLLTLPAALPGIFTGLRLGFGYSWRALVGAELIAASSGLGFLISESAEFAKTETVFVGIFTIAALGVLMDAVLLRLFDRLAPGPKAR